MKNFLLHISNIRQRDLRRIPMVILWVLILLLLMGTTAQAQIIITPLDGATTIDAQTGPYSRVRAECTDADSTNVYVIYQNSVEKYNPSLYICEYTVAIWNGIIWNYLPSFKIITPNDESSVRSMIFYEDELYVAGDFESAVNINNSTYLIKWDGQNWVSAGNFTAKPKGHIKALEIYDNNLIVAGHFEEVDGVFASNIAKYDGTNWSYIGVSGIKQGIEIAGEVRDLHTVNNELFVAGNFSSAGGDNTIRILAKWDGSAWGNPKISLQECYLLGDYNGQLFAYGNEALKPAIYKLEGSTWTNITDPKFKIKSSLTAFTSYEGKLWASGSYLDEVNGGDFKSLLTYDGNKWTMVETDNLGLEVPLNTYPHLTNTKSGLFISGAFTSNKGVWLKYIGKIETSMSVLQGVVFNDNYANCNRDNGEAGAAGRFVMASPGNHIAITDKDGRYLMKVPNGNYTVRILDKKYWHSSCPAVKNGINVSVPNASVVNVIDIPTYGLDYIRDIEITLTGKSGWKMREGYTESYYVCAKNIGTYNLTNAEISVQADTRLKKVSFGEEPIKSSEYNATWSIAVLKAEEQRCFEFTAVAPIEVINNKIVDFIATTNYVTKDEDTHNNIAYLSQRVTSAYDPNNKEVRDPNNSTTSFGDSININKGTDKLDYQINFQNTGNDTAYRVTVVDTINIDHRFTYIKFNHTSHGPPIYSFMLYNNVFIWTFNNIMLPDSGTNQEGSKGFINFTISINSELAQGSVIRNKAYIYFDFQKPVETESSRAKVGKIDNVPPPVQLTDMVYVYPNPANNAVMLENRTAKKQAISITDVTGKVIDEITIDAHEMVLINTGAYAQGVYFIRAREGSAYKLVIQH